MPRLTVTLDGEHLATVPCDGFDVVTARISGTRIDEDFANIGVTGGSYPDEGESTYLTWVNELALRPGQQIHVTLLEAGTASHAGKTLEELFPEEEFEATPDKFKPTHEMFDELRARPKLREGYAFHYHSTLGTQCTGRTGPEDHGVAFSVLWNSHCPECIGISINTYTIDSIEQRTSGTDHVREYLQIGQSATFQVDA
jgi:hypothetical protein